MNRKTAIVIGSSGGIGSAVAESLENGDEYDRVIRFSRSDNSPVSLDITSEATIKDAANYLKSKNIVPSMVFVATGLLHTGEHAPEKSLRHLDRDWLLQNYLVNAVGPALVAKYFLPLSAKNETVKFAVISARVGSISDNRLGGWYGYRASKAALNMMIRNLSIEWSRKNDRSVIVALHPGTVDTKLSSPFQSNVTEGKLFDADYSAHQMLAVLNSLGPVDSGKIFAWDGQEIQP